MACSFVSSSLSLNSFLRSSVGCAGYSCIFCLSASSLSDSTLRSASSTSACVFGTSSNALVAAVWRAFQRSAPSPAVPIGLATLRNDCTSRRCGLNERSVFLVGFPLLQFHFCSCHRVGTVGEVASPVVVGEVGPETGFGSACGRNSLLGQHSRLLVGPGVFRVATSPWSMFPLVGSVAPKSSEHSVSVMRENSACTLPSPPPPRSATGPSWLRTRWVYLFLSSFQC